jgi:HEAT repeat protein
LLSEDEKRRMYASRTLARHASSRQVADFLRSLRDVQWQGKIEGVKILGKLGDKLSVERLKTLVLDFNPRVRQTARKALAKLGITQPFTDDDVVELVGYLEHPSWWVRTSAIKSLAALKDKRAVEPISQCLLDEDETVRLAAGQALDDLKRSKK